MWHFLKAFLPIALMVAAVIAGLHYHGYSLEQNSLRQQQLQWVVTAREAVTRDFEAIGSDLSVLADSKVLRRGLSSSSMRDREQVVEAIASFVEHKRIYTRASYFGVNGGGAFAIDYGDGATHIRMGGEVKPAVGQDLLAYAWSLPPRAIAVSRLELTAGDAAAHPTIRFATPVVGVDGELAGVLVLTYLGERLIEHLRETGTTAGVEMLVTGEGAWLRSQATDGEHRLRAVERDFASSHAAAWRQLQRGKRGQFRTAKGLYTYETAKPIEEVARRVDAEVAPAGDDPGRERVWKIISHIEAPVLAALRRERISRALALYALLLIPVGLGSGYAGRQARHRQRAQDELRQLGRVVAGTSDMIAIADTAERVSYVNPSFTRITGFSAEQAQGRSMSQLQAPAQPTGRLEQLWARARQGEAAQAAVISLRRDGGTFQQQLMIAPLHDARGRLTGYMSSGKDITEQAEAEQRLHRLAFHHPLTHLPNRALFHERLRSAAARARRKGHKLAVLFLDLDRFKQINDSLGHKAGDAILEQVAQRLPRHVRLTDTVAHLGGDEFTVLIDEIHNPTEIVLIAEKVLQSFDAPFRAAGQQLHLSTSVGIAVFPQDTDSVDRLLEDADTAMYHAKREGRNRLQFYAASMTEEANRRLQLETQLRDAMRRPDFVLHYQPIIELGTGRIVALEALLRWQHDNGSLTLPAGFVPALEDSGLIVPLTGWALEEACRALRRWHDAGGAGAEISVNVSARAFHHGDLLERVQAALSGAGLPARALVLEVTEGVLLEESERVRGTLRALDRLGVGIAIDDFGTGYSSLSYLKQIPATSLKIDKSFVLGLDRDPRDAAMVSAILAMAEMLGLQVVAEGVERETQLEFLRERHCERVQGFLLGRPQPLAELEWRASAGAGANHG